MEPRKLPLLSSEGMGGENEGMLADVHAWRGGKLTVEEIGGVRKPQAYCYPEHYHQGKGDRVYL